MHRRTFILGAPLALAACGGGDPIWAPDDVVNAKIYRGTGQKSITLYTMINVWSGNGAHSSLLIDASQRVMFDPAGSFKHETIPERNDVLFGISPRVEEFYVSYHARQTYYVEGQRILVSDEIAERALQLVMANGAVPKSACALAVSKVLRDIPGFENIRRTISPTRIRDDFAKIPGVVTTIYREDDADDKSIAAAQIDAALKTDQ
ncbi:MAG: hypothetical protein MUR46_02820 [Loktanella sp.]|nr:hypothetical protein [Loktanella sp.]MDO7560331.1 hypothetical protein [Paracoccaceae bacterium]MDO7622774.1 hypothetical protein [Loktanella sp.]MDO7626361.1 hypothetical protein [Loktanella sp.]MDO7630404.1 hypothetical protein [Loktanella sp.]